MLESQQVGFNVIQGQHIAPGKRKKKKGVIFDPAWQECLQHLRK